METQTMRHLPTPRWRDANYGAKVKLLFICESDVVLTDEELIEAVCKASDKRPWRDHDMGTERIAVPILRVPKVDRQWAGDENGCVVTFDHGWRLKGGQLAAYHNWAAALAQAMSSKPPAGVIHVSSACTFDAGWRVATEAAN